MKKTSIVFLFLILIPFVSRSQSAQSIKNKSDKNFASKKFAESLKGYKQLIDEHEQFSQRTLLKTAYLSEENHDYPRSLYTLHLLSKHYPDRATLEYIEDMANTYSLTGHELTDWKYLNMLYFRYYNWLVVISILAIFALFYFILVKRRKASSGRLILMISLLSFLALYFNLLKKEPSVIIKDNHTLLMKGPSSASDVVQVLHKGNLYKVTGQTDVWIQISWDDAQKAYVKASQVYLLD